MEEWMIEVQREKIEGGWDTGVGGCGESAGKVREERHEKGSEPKSLKRNKTSVGEAINLQEGGEKT